MLQNDRKTIGVLICDIVYDYQKKLCEGISLHAEKLGYNVAFFANFADYGVNNENIYGEYNIINLPPYKELAALIICSDTYTPTNQEDLFRKYIEKCDCPVVCVRRQIDDNYSVLINSDEAIFEIVEHFVRIHGYKRIAFMSGPSDHPDSIARLNQFKAALEKEGLVFNEDYLFEGDFWKNKGAEAANYFMECVKPRPEAIVCANDYMAIALCSEMSLLGYVSPDDVAISGYDDIAESIYATPPLTTLTISVKDMAVSAVNMVDDILNGKNPDKVKYVKTKVRIRNSCGCNIFDKRALITTKIKQINDYERLLDKTLNDFTAISLQQLDTATNIGAFLNFMKNDDINIRNYFICLGEADLDTYPKYYSSEIGYADYSYSVYSVSERAEIETSVFPTSELIPAEGKCDEPITYFFFPLHYKNFTFGYIAVCYGREYRLDRSLCNRISTISNALENLRMSNQSKKLLEELDRFYKNDIENMERENEEKQRELARTIISSIEYAGRIQRNLLPSESLFQNTFSDYSIIWNPRDIVGGDIYWTKCFKEGTILCVCDCTGHGTPGALLTMLVATSLENIVNRITYRDTAHVIWELDQRLVKVLNSRAGNMDISDGCDIAVLFIGKDGDVRLSSGNMHVFICNGDDVRQLKGQRLRVGEGKIKSKDDVNVITIPADPMNKFYVASDGLFDQVSGKTDLPFGYKKFKKLILDNHSESQSYITKAIWNTFEEYRSGAERLDDFELISFKI